MSFLIGKCGAVIHWLQKENVKNFMPNVILIHIRTKLDLFYQPHLGQFRKTLSSWIRTILGISDKGLW